MVKKLELLILLVVVVGLVLLNQNIGEMVSSADTIMKEKRIVLDAGHGGNDPGKIGVNGVVEKDINLQIVQKVKKLLEEKEIEVIMTREEDEMLCDENEENKKQKDMKERVRKINNANAFLAISIHQNSYTDSSVKGAQVFYYSGSPEGEEMAIHMQKALAEIDESNKRQVKANDNYYLLKYTEIPTIIVECGFLSNSEEAEKLRTEEYQEVVSNAIVQGIEACFGN